MHFFYELVFLVIIVILILYASSKKGEKERKPSEFLSKKRKRLPKKPLKEQNIINEKKENKEEPLKNKKELPEKPIRKSRSGNSLNVKGKKVNEQNIFERDVLIVDNYTAELKDELTLKKGDKVLLTDMADDGWYFGELYVFGKPSNIVGWFPGDIAKEKDD